MEPARPGSLVPGRSGALRSLPRAVSQDVWSMVGYYGLRKRIKEGTDHRSSPRVAMNGAVTFDFHNTLMHAEAWFELEVRELAAAFLGWRAMATASTVSDEALQTARHLYRQLRLRIMDDGMEMPAERCVEVV